MNQINVQVASPCPSFGDWTLGNSVSYVFIYLLYTKKIGYLYVNISDYSITYTLISPFVYFFYTRFYVLCYA